MIAARTIAKTRRAYAKAKRGQRRPDTDRRHFLDALREGSAVIRQLRIWWHTRWFMKRWDLSAYYARQLAANRVARIDEMRERARMSTKISTRKIWLQECLHCGLPFAIDTNGRVIADCACHGSPLEHVGGNWSPAQHVRTMRYAP